MYTKTKILQERKVKKYKNIKYEMKLNKKINGLKYKQYF